MITGSFFTGEYDYNGVPIYHPMGAYVVGEKGTEIFTFSASGSNPRHSEYHTFTGLSDVITTNKGFNEKEFCSYCHGITKTDDRGNCAACGAPRESIYA